MEFNYRLLYFFDGFLGLPLRRIRPHLCTSKSYRSVSKPSKAPLGWLIIGNQQDNEYYEGVFYLSPNYLPFNP